MSAKRRRKPRSRLNRWLRRKTARWAKRKVKDWRQRTKARVRKLTAPRVVYRSVGERQFPNPRRPAPLRMRKLEEEDWRAQLEVVLSNDWRVPFEIDIYRADRPLAEYARDAAVREHGEIVKQVDVVEIVPLNPVAKKFMKDGAR